MRIYTDMMHYRWMRPLVKGWGALGQGDVLILIFWDASQIMRFWLASERSYISLCDFMEFSNSSRWARDAAAV